MSVLLYTTCEQTPVSSEGWTSYNVEPTLTSSLSGRGNYSWLPELNLNGAVYHSYTKPLAGEAHYYSCYVKITAGVTGALFGAGGWWAMRVRDDGTLYFTNTTPSQTVDTSYVVSGTESVSIALKVLRASSSGVTDGSVTIWVNGEQVANQLINNYSSTASPYEFYLTSEFDYREFDEVKIGTEYKDVMHGYNVYFAKGGIADIDYDTPLTFLEYAKYSAQDITTGTLDANSEYTFVIRPVYLGYERPDYSCTYKVTTDASGDWVGNTPSGLSSLSVQSLSDGNYRVIFNTQSGQDNVKADTFKVYYSSGGAWTLADTISARAGDAYFGSYKSSGILTDGVYTFKVIPYLSDVPGKEIESDSVKIDATDPSPITPTISKVF